MAEARLVRIAVPRENPRLALYDGTGARELLKPSGEPVAALPDVLTEARRTGKSALEVVRGYEAGAPHAYRELDRPPDPEHPHLLLPVVPDEVWAAGVTYERSREARLAETTTTGIYDRVYDAKRPEVFFKATASRCVGPNVPVGIRCDSRWTVPEPELGVLLDQDGGVAGYTLGNDMSARDIEGDNPLYLPQTKIYRACCALGPAVLLSNDPVERNLTLWCRIERGGREVFRGEVSTARLRRPIAELVSCLRLANDIPPLTVLLTGTGIVPPDDFACEEGDLIEIGAERIGVLRNPAIRVA